VRLTRASLALVAGACASDPPVAEDCAPPEPPGDVAYGSPALLPDTGCEPGALAGVDADVVWLLEARLATEPDAVYARNMTRIGESCGALAAPGDAYAEQSADHLYWFTRGGTAYKACRVESDGSLWGHWGFCVLEDFCRSGTFVARRFGRVEGEADGDGLELLSAWSGPPETPWAWTYVANVRVRDAIAYLVGGSALRIVDVGDPSAPRDLGTFEAPFDSFNDVKIVDAPPRRYALLASDTLGVVVVDVTSPDAPREVRRFSPNAGPRVRGVHTLFTETYQGRTWAYFVSGRVPLLTVYDVTDPERPAAVARYELATLQGFHDLYVEERVAYINAEGNGLIVVDFSDPDSPRFVGQGLEDLDLYSHSNWVTRAGGRTISVHGGEGYDSSVHIVDVDPASVEFMQPIAEFRRRPEVSVHNIMAIGERAYVAYYQDGLRVLDLSDPTDPREVAHYNTWDADRAGGWYFEGAMGVDVDPDRGLIYVADTTSGLVILREGR
jgi:hypothetical protein